MPIRVQGSQIHGSPVPKSPGPRSQVLGSAEYSVPTVSGLLLNSTARTIYGLCGWVGGVTMYTVDYSVKPLLGREWAIEFLPKKTSKSFFHSDTQVCCVATGNPLIASSAMHWVCYPRSLKRSKVTCIFNKFNGRLVHLTCSKGVSSDV